MGKVLTWLGNKVVWAVMLAVVLSCLTAYCIGRSDGKLAVTAQIERENREVLERALDASGISADERLADSKKADEQRKELKDACSDESADDCRVRRGCIILRQQGTDTSSLAACQRLGV